MNVSIVIPVYNEADLLSACLEAIARQSVRPHEVIVVDNNSTDGSAAVAASFSFVKVVTEAKQGVAYARNKGFNAATGEIIGRIDADTILPEAWVSQIQSIFTDESVSAVSGAPHYYDFAFYKLAEKIDYSLRGHLAKKLDNENFLWGANMAVRRTDWLKIQSELCSVADIHEDFDLGIHLQAHDLKVIYDQTLVAGVSSRRIDTSFTAYFKYSLVNTKTYKLHKLKSRFHMYPVLAVCWLAYPPARLIYRSYNHETQSFSINKLLQSTTPRVDPTANTI